MLRLSRVLIPPAKPKLAPVDEADAEAAGVASVWRRLLVLCAAAALLLATVPLFFDIYRLAAFDTAPRDDYAPHLLALIGDRGEPPLRQPNLFAGAPFGYRFGSVAVAVPFYYALPLYEFTNLDNPDVAYLKATQALAFVSYLAIVLTAVFVYKIARQRLGASVPAAVIVAMASFALSGFVGRTGVDPLAILVVSVLVYYLANPFVFAPLMVLSAAINEKILFIIGALLLGRAALMLWDARGELMAGGGRGQAFWQRARTFLAAYWLPGTAFSLSVLAYLGLRLVLRLSGDGHRTDTSLWLPKALSTLADTVSLKGMVTNGLPIAILVVIIVLALVAYRRRDRAQIYFQPSDVICAVVLLTLALIINAKFTGGRLVMHSFPIYLPFVAHFIDAQFGLSSRRVAGERRADDGVSR